ncbi:MAG: Hsp33 family molecular chaperone HslO [Pseudomonadales bacterium]|nr:Hsp33 family molecular chaperone HslO [Pseudomonadales bacterium]
MANQLLSFMFDNTDIRGGIVELDEAFQRLLQAHDYAPQYRQLLSQFVGANILLTSKLKFEGVISLQARGRDTAVSLALSECDEQLNFRGILRGDMPTQPLSFADLFHQGVLALTLEPKYGQRYQGMVPLEQANLAACLADYFQMSEQLPSWFYLLADEQCVRGLMLQALPAQVCDDEEQRREDWQRLTHLASTIQADEIRNLESHELLHRLFHEEQVRIFPAQPVNFHCSCSQERMERALIGLGKVELESILLEQGKIETQCEFCGRSYAFSSGEIQHLLQSSCEQ